MPMTGRFDRKFYHCANFYGDFQELYRKEFTSENSDGCKFLDGMTVYNFPNWKPGTVKQVLKKLNLKNADVELHGINKNFVNLGIYADEIIDIECNFTAKNVGHCLYEEISK